MSWLVSNWRLKLLALALTLGLLGAVAFSENPVVFKTVQANVSYAGLHEGIVLIDPAKTVNIQVSALADAASGIKPENIEVRADLSKVRAGTDTTVNAQVRALVPNVNPLSGGVPIHVTTDTVTQRTLDIQVRTPNFAPGWTVLQDPKKTFAQCQPDTSIPCKVTLTGPTTLIQDVRAFVTIQPQINTDKQLLPSQTVRFERAGQPVDFTKVNTQPEIGWDPPIVSVEVSASRGTAQRSVGLNVPVTGRPACGFAVTAVSIAPGNGVVTISGPADVVINRDTIDGDGIDIGGANANVGRTVRVRVPDQVTAQPASVQVTVTIQKQFDCTAPTPTPTPSPKPT